MGISAQDLPLVFKRFYRCDGSRSQSGAGLGLSVCRHVVEQHGGTITCSDTPGGGTTFTVRI